MEYYTTTTGHKMFVGARNDEYENVCITYYKRVWVMKQIGKTLVFKERENAVKESYFVLSSFLRGWK